MLAKLIVSIFIGAAVSPLLADQLTILGAWRDPAVSSPCIIKFYGNGAFFYMCGAAAMESSGKYALNGKSFSFQNAPPDPQAPYPPEMNPGLPAAAALVDLTLDSITIDFKGPADRGWGKRTFKRMGMEPESPQVLATISIQKITGKWTFRENSPEGAGYVRNVEFRTNGTFSVSGPSGAVDGTYRVNQGVIVSAIAQTQGQGAEWPLRMQTVEAATDRIVVVLEGPNGLEWGEPHVLTPEGGSNFQPAGPAEETETKVTPAGTDFTEGAKVLVLWQGSWYPATILKTGGGKFQVRYDGYDSSWDEWVGTERLKPR